MGSDPRRYHDQPRTATVVVPPGLNPGELIKFDGPDGGQLEVAVPEGRAAGDRFQVQLPEALAVTVPEGARPGEMMQFDAPDGTRMQVAVPEDRAPGDRFQVQLALQAAAPPAASCGEVVLTVPKGAHPGQLV